MRLQVTGIAPKASSIAPFGIHLRWNLPSWYEGEQRQELGFPETGFTIYRKKHGYYPIEALDKFQNRNNATELKVGLITLHKEANTSIIAEGTDWRIGDNTPANTQILIAFSTPIIYAEITYSHATGDNLVEAYRGKTKITSDSTLKDSDQQTLLVHGSYFNNLLLSLNFGILNSIKIVTEIDFLADSEWEELVNLPLMKDASNIIDRLEPAIKNRYITNKVDADERYNKKIKELTYYQQQLLGGTDDFFITPPANPCSNVQTSPVSLRSILMVSATDPNIARLLSLYYVDQYDPQNSMAKIRPPNTRTSYDYKVAATYDKSVVEEDGGQVMGMVIGLGDETSELPVSTVLTKAEQQPGFEWNEQTPLGRAGLRWAQPEPSWAPTHPVFYDLYRKSVKESNYKIITPNFPISVASTIWSDETKNMFINKGVDLGEYHYGIKSVDIFGQESGFSKDTLPPTVVIEDKTPPPPPVKLNASVFQEGFPWLDPNELSKNTVNLMSAKITFSFEYGHAQHTQAPDAEFFHFYWRKNNIRQVAKSKIENLDNVIEKGLNKYTITDETIDDLSIFEGGVFSLLSKADKKTLPNTERLKIRIDNIDHTEQKLTLATVNVDLESGDYFELISDPVNKNNWTYFAEGPKIGPPFFASVIEVRDAQITVIAESLKINETAHQANEVTAGLPGGARPDSGTEFIDQKELLIDRDLLEPHLFSKGKIANTAINYSTHGAFYAGQIPPAEDNDDALAQFAAAARISVNSDEKISIGHPMALQSQGNTRVLGHEETYQGDIVKYVVKEIVLAKSPETLEKKPAGGELALFFSYIPPDSADACRERKEATLVARVVSSVKKIDPDNTSLLVKIRLEDWVNKYQHKISESKLTAIYYPPYLITDLYGDIKLTGEIFPTDKPCWENDIEAGILHGFIAIAASDHRKNRGPLSRPVEASVIKPPPIGIPNPPVPCNMPSTQQNSPLNKWYATPPNLDGKASICLKWSPKEITPATGLRCDISRALDTTIIAADKKNWLLGIGVEPSEFGALEALTIQDEEQLTNGLIAIDIALESNSELLDAGIRKTFVQGRLTVVTEAGDLTKNQYYKITKATLKPISENNTTSENNEIPTLSLLLQSMVRNQVPIGNAICYMQVPPDYSSIKRNDDALKQLADKPENITAFGLVTGAAIKADENNCFDFIDEIPGIGSNRYFYKARAVDAAENKTVWSAASMPFYQVDTTIPPPPQGIEVDSGASITISWQVVPDAVAYLVHRIKLSDQTSSTVTQQNNPFEIVSNDRSRQRILMRAHSISLQSLPVAANSYALNDLSSGIEAIYQLPVDGDFVSSVNLIVHETTTVVNHKIINVNPLLPSNTDLAVKALEPNVIVLTHDLFGKPLRANLGTIRIDYPHQHFQILGVYRSNEFNHDAHPVNLQQATNLFGASTSYDDNIQTILNLDNTLEESNLIVIARSEKVFTLKSINGSLFPLRLINDVIDLNVAASIHQIIGVYELDDFDIIAMPLEAQTGTNYFTSTSEFAPNEMTIKKLAVGMLDTSHPVIVMRVSTANGGMVTTFISHHPWTNQPLIIQNRSISLALTNITGIVGIQVSNTASSGENQRKLNYALHHPSQFTSDKRLINLNPLIEDETPLVIIYRNTEGKQRQIKRLPHRVEFVDSLRNNDDELHRSYQVQAVREVVVNDTKVRLLSLPSRVVRGVFR